MPAIVATPVVAYATTTSWIAAPAIGKGDFSWLEVGRNDGNLRTVAAFRGDRLIVRSAGKNTIVVDQPCISQPCQTVQAPVTGAAGAFAYAVAFPGVGRFVASVAANGLSRVVAEDVSDPATITTPHLVATTGSAVVWVDQNSISIAPNTGGTAAILVSAEQVGGEITSLSAGPAGIAWSARATTGGTLIGYRSATGAISTRAAEPDAKVATLYSVALMDDGSIVAIRRTVRTGRQTIELASWAVDGTRKTLLSSVPFAQREAFEVTRPTVSGTLVAVRSRAGAGGRQDALWVLDRATGRRMRFAVADRWVSRFSDPSFGNGRLVWAKTDLRSGRLQRARIFSAAVRG